MITSISNERVKRIRHLRDRKHRAETGLYLIEGLRLVIEAIQLSAEIEFLIVAPELLTSDIGKKVVAENSKKIEIVEVSQEVFRSFSHKDGPQGIAAIIRQRWTTITSLDPIDGLWVALDSVADPGNLGAILRTTEAAGGKGVILLDQSTDPYDPTTIRASMGSLFNLQLFKTSFGQFEEWKRGTNVMTVGTDGEADLDYRQLRYPCPIILLMGSEREGLLSHHYQLCDEIVRIPMLGRSDSLNLAVATGIVIYEIFNQWHPVRGENK